MSEVQFLQAKSDGGSMINVTASVTSPGNNVVICSYTPATGTTFVLFSGEVVTQGLSATADLVELRNNGTVRGIIPVSGGNTGPTIAKFANKGDTLIGNSTETYDIFNLNTVAGIIVGATLTGYLE